MKVALFLERMKTMACNRNAFKVRFSILLFRASIRENYENIKRNGLNINK
jgi:hypothetical protein